MPKRKLTPEDKAQMRAAIKASLGKGEKLIDIVNRLSSEYKIVPETVRWYIKGVQENRPVRPPGRPKGSGKRKKGRPGRPPRAARRGPGRSPKAAGRPTRQPDLFFLGADTAQIVLRHGGKETRIASIVYGDKSRLVSAVRSALSSLK